MTTRLKCVLLDDELPGLTYLKMLCEQIDEVEIVKVFNDPAKFLSSVSTLDFDACILDIEMPKIDGLEVARNLKDRIIIFATAYKQYAADAFDLDATDFVGKPITKERLQVAIQKAIARKRSLQENRSLRFNTDKGKALINIIDIAFISSSEIDSRDKVLVMTDGSSIVLKTISFETLTSQLPPADFCRVNKKQILSIKIVASFTHNQITTKLDLGSSPLTLSLSETYRQNFKEMIEQIS